jgi:hypothetical protein
VQMRQGAGPRDCHRARADSGRGTPLLAAIIGKYIS